MCYFHRCQKKRTPIHYCMAKEHGSAFSWRRKWKGNKTRIDNLHSCKHRKSHLCYFLQQSKTRSKQEVSPGWPVRSCRTLWLCSRPLSSWRPGCLPASARWHEQSTRHQHSSAEPEKTHATIILPVSVLVPKRQETDFLSCERQDSHTELLIKIHDFSRIPRFLGSVPWRERV